MQLNQKCAAVIVDRSWRILGGILIVILRVSPPLRILRFLTHRYLHEFNARTTLSTLYDWMRAPVPGRLQAVDNGLVRRFCGRPCWNETTLGISHLRLAVRNLLQFTLVWDVDGFDQGTPMLHTILGWPNVRLRSLKFVDRRRVNVCAFDIGSAGTNLFTFLFEFACCNAPFPPFFSRQRRSFASAGCHHSKIGDSQSSKRAQHAEAVLGRRGQTVRLHSFFFCVTLCRADRVDVDRPALIEVFFFTIRAGRFLEEHNALDSRFYALAKRLGDCMVRQVGDGSGSLVRARDAAYEGMPAEVALYAKRAAMGVTTRDIAGLGALQSTRLPRQRVAPRLRR